MSTASLSSRVYEEILGRILSGRLNPGQVFNRRQIATELEVSVAPVLEAMVELQAEGIIETLPRKGTRVRILTLPDLQGQLVIREALEAEAARLACGEPVRRHLKRLTRLAEELDSQPLDAPKRLKDEIRLHHYLVSLAGVPALSEAHDRVMKLGVLYAIQSLPPDQRGSALCSHVELVKALTVADPDEAESVARAHIRSGRDAIFNQNTPSDANPFTSLPQWLQR